VIYYYTTGVEKAKKVLREGLQASPKYPVYVTSSPESILSEIHSTEWAGTKKSNLVTLELRGLSRKSSKGKSVKENWTEGDDILLIKAVPPEKIRVFSGMGYSEQIDLSGPVIKKLWVDVGNKPKER
jgi:hypothetical protein